MELKALNVSRIEDSDSKSEEPEELVDLLLIMATSYYTLPQKSVSTKDIEGGTNQKGHK